VQLGPCLVGLSRLEEVCWLCSEFAHIAVDAIFALVVRQFKAMDESMFRNLFKLLRILHVLASGAMSPVKRVTSDWTACILLQELPG
jgi:hypothetical protein